MAEFGAVTKHRLLLALGGATLVAGAALAFGSPRVVWLNTGPRMEYAPAVGIAAGAAAMGASLVAAAATQSTLRLASGLLGVFLLVLAAQRLLHRLDVVQDGVHVRGLFGSRSLPWSAVAHVDARPEVLMLVDEKGGAVEIGTASLTADQRASLERTVARRVREAAGQTGTKPLAPAPLPSLR